MNHATHKSVTFLFVCSVLLLSLIACTTVLVSSKPTTAFERSLYADLEQKGAIVTRTKFTLTIDCKTLPFVPGCDNVPNPSLIYQPLFVPCNPSVGCTKADYFHIPLTKITWGWTLSNQEALIYFVEEIAPTDTYWSYNLDAYEREEINIPNPAEYQPPKPGEIIPAPSSPTRYVTSGAMGENFNIVNARTGPNPNHNEKPSRESLAMVFSPNQVVMDSVVASLKKAGIKASAINTRGLPDFMVHENTDTADTFRLISRLGRPYDQGDMDQWISNSPNNAYRVTFVDGDLPVTGYAFPELADPTTGHKELPDQASKDSFTLFESQARAHFGDPDLVLNTKQRTYDTESCLNTGTYCWGYIRDALYVNIIDPTTNEQAFFDVSQSPTARVVFVGVDHEATGFTKFWNVGLFTPEGPLIAGYDFVDKQSDEWGFENGNPIDEHLFWIQIKQTCEASDEHCLSIEEGAVRGATEFQLINRNYLNATTGTAPVFDEVQLPVIYVYH